MLLFLSNELFLVPFGLPEDALAPFGFDDTLLGISFLLVNRKTPKCLIF